MAIVNLTPDSFYEPSRVWSDTADAAVARIRQLLADGADIIDLGAVSTRPGAADVPVEEEWRRLEPVLKALSAAKRADGRSFAGAQDDRRGAAEGRRGAADDRRGAAEGRSFAGAQDDRRGAAEGRSFAGAQDDRGGVQDDRRGAADDRGDAPDDRRGATDDSSCHSERSEESIVISIDTTSAEIVRRAHCVIGDFIVNDISAGEDDPEMLPTVAELGLPYIAMHKRGNPRSMDSLAEYPDGIIAELLRYFEAFAAKAEALGIHDWILDPGLGFAKTVEQNWEILENLEQLKVFGRPILIGAADKRFTRGNTAAAHDLAIAHGADILRVHELI